MVALENSGMLLPNPTCHGWDMDNASAVDPTISKFSGHVELSSNVLRSLKAVDDITAAIARDNLTDVVTGKKSHTTSQILLINTTTTNQPKN